MTNKEKRALYICSGVEIGTLAIMGYVGSLFYPARIDVAFGCFFLSAIGIAFNITETILYAASAKQENKGQRK